MRKGHHSHSKKKALVGKNLVILPLVSCAAIYAICAALILPSMSSYIAMANMFFSDKETTFSNDYVNIFVPVEDPPESSDQEEPETSSPAETSGSEKKPSKPSPKNTVKISSFTFPSYDNQFGELIIDDCQVYAKLFFGDSSNSLKNGVGIYYGSAIPGYGRTILVAGHNNTYFNGLKYAQKGQIVRIRTNYGNYQYEITDTQVWDKDDRSAYDLSAAEEQLILYTCYPFDTLGLTSNRLFVYCRFVSGPVIDKNN